MSIRLRLTLLYTGLLAAALMLFSLTGYSVFRWTFMQSVDRTLEGVGSQVAWHFRNRGVLPNSLVDRSTYVLVRTETAEIARASREGFEGLFPLPEAAKRGETTLTNETDSRGTAYRLYTLPISDGEKVIFYIQAAYVLQMLNATTDRLLWPWILGTVVFIGLAGLAAWWLAGRAVAPIHQLARAAQAIGVSADLSLRVPSVGKGDEVGTLVTTFNQMLDQLEGLYGRLAASVDAQRRFAADASHELRTPLTIIRGNLDYLRRVGELDPEALNDMASEAERMTRLVEELLTVARSDSGLSPDLQPVVLGPLLREACRKAHALPHQAEFRSDLPEALDRVTVLGSAEWLMRLLLILIDNAFKYTPEGSVTVRAGRQGEGVVIQVSDTGLGIAREDLPHIFDRFYRADRARGRGGAGLGLAIARWVAGVHGGTLTAESELGRGSTFSLWLPLQPRG